MLCINYNYKSIKYVCTRVYASLLCLHVHVHVHYASVHSTTGVSALFTFIISLQVLLTSKSASNIYI